MYTNQQFPRQLYDDRLRAAEVARLYRALQRAQGRDRSARLAAGDALIRAGVRLRGELPIAPQPTTNHS